MSSAQHIIADNLRTWRTASADIRELRLLGALDAGRRLAMLTPSDALPDPSFLPAEELPNTPLVGDPDAFLHTLAVEEQIAFCRGFLSVRPLTPTGDEEQGAPPPAAPRIAFLESPFAREALRTLGRILPHARPVTVPNFTAVCEELASDHADFALLPLEDSQEGKLMRPLQAIDSFSFRITHTCEIPYPDGGRSVTMALLTQRYLPTAKRKGEQMLGCRVSQQTPFTLSDLLIAARQCGLTLRRVDSLPTPYGEDGVIYFPVFRATEGEVALFEAYLTLFQPSAQLIGTYTHITR